MRSSVVLGFVQGCRNAWQQTIRANQCDLVENAGDSRYIHVDAMAPVLLHE